MTGFLAQLTPAWLTEALREHGHLERGQVRQIDIVETSETLPSRHVRFVATYSPEAPRAAPTRLFLKLTKPEYLSAAEHEHHFYATIAPRMQASPLVPWYGAGVATGTAYLLLADVSATHRPWDNGPLPWAHLAAMASVLARVHARWWGHSALGELVGEQPEATVRDGFAQATARFEELANRLGDQLTAGMCTGAGGEPATLPHS